jgi:predicted acyl esterase
MSRPMQEPKTSSASRGRDGELAASAAARCGKPGPRNVTDGIIRLEPGQDIVTVPMSPTAYQFGSGHRIRLQVSGGAFPRFARNTGTGEPPATAVRLAPTDIEIRHDGTSVLLLPAARF